MTNTNNNNNNSMVMTVEDKAVLDQMTALLGTVTQDGVNKIASIFANLAPQAPVQDENTVTISKEMFAQLTNTIKELEGKVQQQGAMLNNIQPQQQVEEMGNMEKIKNAASNVANSTSEFLDKKVANGLIPNTMNTATTFATGTLHVGGGLLEGLANIAIDVIDGAANIAKATVQTGANIGKSTLDLAANTITDASEVVTHTAQGATMTFADMFEQEANKMNW